MLRVSAELSIFPCFNTENSSTLSLLDTCPSFTLSFILIDLKKQHILLILCPIKSGAFCSIFFYLDILKIRACFEDTQAMQRQMNGGISNY